MSWENITKEEKKVNLYEELMYVLKKHNVVTEKAIKYVMNSRGKISIADFLTAARACNYENDYGIVKIDPSLRIVGRSWWLSRESYDGREGFRFHKRPLCPENTIKDVNLFEIGIEPKDINFDFYDPSEL